MRSTHEISDAESLFDYIVFLQNGQVVQQVPPMTCGARMDPCGTSCAICIMGRAIANDRICSFSGLDQA